VLAGLLVAFELLLVPVLAVLGGFGAGTTGGFLLVVLFSGAGVIVSSF